MKRILGVVIALVCLMSLISCGGKQTTAAYTEAFGWICIQ